jgi:TetR/AcrR family transcriptional regulator, regulator of cefoperazone and chloramphenicol sensitivity
MIGVDTVANAGTRHRVLEVARELFAENGYAGTSIADIADRLGVTKAAVYYHFRAKSDLLNELIRPMFAQLQTVLEDPPADPRTLLERVVELLAAQRNTINLVAGDPSVLHELDHRLPLEFFGRLIDVLAGSRPSATRRLRARCALGAIHAAVVGPVVQRRAAGAAAGKALVPMTAHERRVAVDAALAALG